jgi:hypothetical protein
MQLDKIEDRLSEVIKKNSDVSTAIWLEDRISKTIGEKSAKELYLTYSLIASKIKKQENLALFFDDPELRDYLEIQKANAQQMARTYLLIRVLKDDEVFFAPKVANIIQVADTSELETFLKFLILLPHPEKYKKVAVDALRTNIATVFNAIAYHNPYPSQYFDEQQWNQMYLKTAFMQGDLSAIRDIDKRANKQLARIISDYAHERWAASRDIDPYFWRPVARFLDAPLLADMEKLLTSANRTENKAGALCCYYSDDQKAKKLADTYQSEFGMQIKNKKISWENLKK